MLQRLSILAVLATLALAISSCANVTNERDVQVFTDVPYPSGFLLDRDASESQEDDAVRSGRFILKGRGKPEDVIQFYRESMPALGWSLSPASSSDPNSDAYLKYSQECIVTVSQEGENTVVRLDVRGPAL